MSSAAKLRKLGRGTATIATAALVMTSFGPAALAWTGTSNSDSNEAGVGSIGLVDANIHKPDTQGATSVMAGKANETVGEIRFVVPNTWQKDDYIDFTLGATGAPGLPSDAPDYVAWSSTPQVTIDPTAFDEKTRVTDDSPTASTAPEGSVEGHKEVKWKNPDPNSSTAPIAPAYNVSLVDTGKNTVARVTFTNSASTLPVAGNAKFIGTINSPQVNVGANVKGGVHVTVTSNTPGLKLGTDTATVANKTAIAAIQLARLDVADREVVADDTSQSIGSITYASADGKAFTDLSEGLTVGLSGGSFDTDAEATVTWYDANGNILDKARKQKAGAGATFVVGGAPLSPTAIPAGAAKVVVTGAMVKSTSQTMTYSVAAGADAMTGATPIDLSGVAYHQTDIETPPTGVSVEAVNLKDEPTTRMSGANRYQTAAAAAERLTGTNGQDGDGNATNVVLASGDSYADALSAAYLAAVKEAPILLTTKDSVSSATAEFIRSRGVKNVYIIGGTGVVSDDVENALKGTKATDKPTSGDPAAATQNNITVLRLAGSDRFKTNRIANQFAVGQAGAVGTTYTKFGAPKLRTGIVTTGMAPWDALSAGTLVGNATAGNTADLPLPIVLTNGPSLHNEAISQFDSMGIKRALVVGGDGAVAGSVTDGMANAGVNVIRLAGSDRFGTNRAVLNFAMTAVPSATNSDGGFGWSVSTRKPILANSGQPNPGGWVDALAVSPVAAASSLPILLTPADALAPATKDALTAFASDLEAPALVSGGYASVSEKVVSQANAIIAP